MATKRPGIPNVAEVKVTVARRELDANPNVTAKFIQDKYNYSMSIAQRALKSARYDVEQEAKELISQDDELKERAATLKVKQHEKAIDVLFGQMARVERLPQILIALRKKVFRIDKHGTIIAIKKHIKSYDKEGRPIELTPASIVNEYLAAEKAVLEQERLITGIAAAERATAARAGATNISLSVPISPNRMAQVKPAKVIDTTPSKPEDE